MSTILTLFGFRKGAPASLVRGGFGYEIPGYLGANRVCRKLFRADELLDILGICFVGENRDAPDRGL